MIKLNYIYFQFFYNLNTFYQWKELDSFFLNGYRGIRIIDACYKSGKYVMVTIKVTDKTYKMAEFLEKRMK